MPNYLDDNLNQSEFLDINYLDVLGKKAYSRRMWTIETVFANITSNKGLDRISLRGEAKATKL